MSEREPLRVKCPGCNAKGCGYCGDRGDFAVTKPIPEVVPARLFRLIEMVEMFEHGAMPVAGGSLDQSAWFVTAATFISSERNAWASG
ncbi:MAG: hypothetical protein AAGA29_04990 [Planctomycetota bacterium]